jgi:hypothetical protein
MNLHARLRRKQTRVQPVVKPAVACERVMLEAQRLAQQVVRSRAAAQG